MQILEIASAKGWSLSQVWCWRGGILHPWNLFDCSISPPVLVVSGCSSNTITLKLISQPLIHSDLHFSCSLHQLLLTLLCMGGRVGLTDFNLCQTFNNIVSMKYYWIISFVSISVLLFLRHISSPRYDYVHETKCQHRNNLKSFSRDLNQCNLICLSALWLWMKFIDLFQYDLLW